MVSDSVADVPNLRETSALFASSKIVKSPPVSAVIACEASTAITELVAVNPVPANKVATSAIASLACVPVAPPSKNKIKSPLAIAASPASVKSTSTWFACTSIKLPAATLIVTSPPHPPPVKPSPATTLVISPSIAVPAILNVLPDAKLIPESSTSKISVPSTLNVNLP